MEAGIKDSSLAKWVRAVIPAKLSVGTRRWRRYAPLHDAVSVLAQFRRAPILRSWIPNILSKQQIRPAFRSCGRAVAAPLGASRSVLVNVASETHTYHAFSPPSTMLNTINISPITSNIVVRCSRVIQCSIRATAVARTTSSTESLRGIRAFARPATLHSAGSLALTTVPWLYANLRFSSSFAAGWERSSIDCYRRRQRSADIRGCHTP